MGKIFLSYASDDRPLAKDIQARLRQHGHDVFFDEDELKPSDGYDKIIQNRIAKSDIMIFLCSENSLKPGRYTLTELEMAERMWPSPQGRVLPVLVGGTTFDDLPSYLKGLSAYRYKGDPVSEITHLAEEMVGKRRRKKRLWWGAGAGAVGAAALAGLWLNGQMAQSDIAEPAAATEAAEERPVLNPDLHRVNITDQDVDNFNNYDTVMARPVGISVCPNQPFNVFNSSSRRIMLRIAVAYSDMHEDFGPLEPDGFREIDAGEGLGLFIVDARTDNVLHFVDLEATNCG